MFSSVFAWIPGRPASFPSLTSVSSSSRLFTFFRSEQESRGLRADPRHPQDLEQAAGDLPLQLLVDVDPARVRELPDLVGEVLADPREGVKLSSLMAATSFGIASTFIAARR